ncbi:hypothetical protein CPB86DRAFT_818033 [Serendipita vermifera]|nr:hypothetical protein CPB86DRAFT_818033 [Serendipita vermifera]
MSFDVLATFMAVARQSHLILEPPLLAATSTLDFSRGRTFDREKLRSALKTLVVQYEESDEAKYDYGFNSLRLKILYETQVNREVDQVISDLESHWPEVSRNFSLPETKLLKVPRKSKRELQLMLTGWSLNWSFFRHINHVCRALIPVHAPLSRVILYDPDIILQPEKQVRVNLPTLRELMGRTVPPSHSLPAFPSFSSDSLDHSLDIKSATDLRGFLLDLRSSAQNNLERFYIKNLHNSIDAFESTTQTLDPTTPSPNSDLLQISQKSAIKAYERDFNSIRDAILTTAQPLSLMEATGILNMITPITILKQLSLSNRVALSTSWKVRLVQYAITLQSAQQVTRMLRFLREKRMHLFKFEAQNKRKWDPFKYPDWILVEIDANISIRQHQADMAMAMMEPPGDKNSIMQLNMGEGKSSVIVPIVSLSAADAFSALSRVIVPRSQLRQQFHILRQTITSFCDRRIFHLPFKRDIKIDEELANQIHQFLSASAQSGAIWLCEPEQLLSLKLLGLDQSLRNDFYDRTGEYIMKIQTWLHNNARDIIDESDEVLHTKQQVIYTVGHQTTLDAAPWRWEVLQKLLHLLVQYLDGIEHGEHGSSAFLIEQSKQPGAFPTLLRFHNSECDHIIRDFIIQSINDNEWSIRSTLVSLSLQLVTTQEFPQIVYQTLLKHYPETQSQTIHTLLLLRGMLQTRVLLHIFKDERYRVNYGLDLKRSLLAVPYRAKDLPSPRSEFGHPDVTIVLTCLSYYYGGLDLEMTRQTLNHLTKSSTPDITYTEWLKPCWNVIPMHLRTLAGVNMHDEKIVEGQLYPLLRFNKRFIDSYLNWIVFPRQAREFPSKLSSSGWDIALTKKHTTTGFSGTNDGRFLLPVTVTQLDRPAQLHTNAKVLSCLLREENRAVYSHSYDGDSSDLLKRALEMEPPPTVILDVGAQVLDRSNVEFSRVWLSQWKDHPTIKAAVFFEGDELMVLTPDGLAQSLMDSPYSERLDQCLVYLDDAHTRGTDLRLPDVRALVTLGPKLTKDKLVQGCMRMRKLGQGQSVTFLASDEVIHLIADAAGCTIHNVTSKEVLLWTIKETWKQLQSNLPAYMVQGHSFVRREAKWKDFRGGIITPLQLSKALCEQESRSLAELYGPGANNEHSWIWQYHSPNSNSEVSREIYQRCREFDTFSLGDANLYEEKEVELVHEKETERVVERTQAATPAPHQLHKDLIQFVSTGWIPLNSQVFRTVDRALQRTSLRTPRGLQEAMGDILVTEDFCRTIQVSPYSSTAGAMDNFLRPVEWILIPSTSHAFVVALSPFEANELFNHIKASRNVQLYVFSPRNNLSMETFEDFDSFILPSQTEPPTLPPHLVHQINLFSGSIFIRDYQTYSDICHLLRLYFDKLDSEGSSNSPDVIDSTFFVVDPGTRYRLGMDDPGFEESPVLFLRNLLIMRRHGQGLGPSHMGKLLQGVKLKEEDFIDQE